VSKYHLSAEEIRRIRRALGKTQTQFAERLCVDAVTVARWETDQRKCTGLYAKTIAELDLGNLTSIKKDSKMEEEQEIRTVGLHQAFSFTASLTFLLQFLYKEVPVSHRNQIITTYQEWFEGEAYSSDFFKGVCNQKLIHAIGYFCRLITSGPMHPNKTNGYGRQKLGNSHANILAIAKQLAPGCQFAQDSSIEPDLEPRQRYVSIQFVLDDLLAEPTLKSGDIVLLKFYRTLLNFAKEEMTMKKRLPIPATLSFAFAKVLEIALTGPITIAVPNFDAHSEIEDLDHAMRGWLVNR